ncbi:MAG: hypothetical protein PHT12_04595 [Patescibacteria group bacterium]|nr:hypothetical protein [Patescibacteria group bacterium]
MERPRFEQPPSQPNENQPPREQPFERIFGLTEEMEGPVQEETKTLFLDQTEVEDELEKTTDEIETIEAVIEALPGFIGRYGGRPLPFTPEHVHLIEGSPPPGMNLEAIDYDTDTQNVRFLMRPGAEIPNLVLAHHTAHEFLHWLSFHSAQLKEGEIAVRRAGFLMAGAKKDVIYGTAINEAMNEELAKRLIRQMEKTSEVVMDDVRRRQAMAGEFGLTEPASTEDLLLINHLDKEDYASPVQIHRFTYPDERAVLNAVIDGIAAKHADRFTDREQVFDVFARAYFSGRLLEIGHLIEGTYGKGSFRRLWEGEDITKQQAALPPSEQAPSGEHLENAA